MPPWNNKPLFIFKDSSLATAVSVSSQFYFTDKPLLEFQNCNIALASRLKNFKRYFRFSEYIPQDIKKTSGQLKQFYNNVKVVDKKKQYGIDAFSFKSCYFYQNKFSNLQEVVKAKDLYAKFTDIKPDILKLEGLLLPLRSTEKNSQKKQPCQVVVMPLLENGKKATAYGRILAANILRDMKNSTKVDALYWDKVQSAFARAALKMPKIENSPEFPNSIRRMIWIPVVVIGKYNRINNNTIGLTLYIYTPDSNIPEKFYTSGNPRLSNFSWNIANKLAGIIQKYNAQDWKKYQQKHKKLVAKKAAEKTAVLCYVPVEPKYPQNRNLTVEEAEKYKDNIFCRGFYRISSDMNPLQKQGIKTTKHKSKANALLSISCKDSKTGFIVTKRGRKAPSFTTTAIITCKDQKGNILFEITENVKSKGMMYNLGHEIDSTGQRLAFSVAGKLAAKLRDPAIIAKAEKTTAEAIK